MCHKNIKRRGCHHHSLVRAAAPVELRLRLRLRRGPSVRHGTCGQTHLRCVTSMWRDGIDNAGRGWSPAAPSEPSKQSLTEMMTLAEREHSLEGAAGLKKSAMSAAADQNLSPNSSSQWHPSIFQVCCASYCFIKGVQALCFSSMLRHVSRAIYFIDLMRGSQVYASPVKPVI